MEKSKVCKISNYKIISAKDQINGNHFSDSDLIQAFPNVQNVYITIY